MATQDQTIRAWKDPSYRARLTPDELAALPSNPAGPTWGEMDPQELGQLLGRPSDPKTFSNDNSCGYFCTLTTECPSTPLWTYICCGC